MAWRSIVRLLAPFLLILFSALVCGQSASLTPQSSGKTSASMRSANSTIASHPVSPQPKPQAPRLLPQLVHSAGIIFSGHVISVGEETFPGKTHLTTITFRVERAIRGATSGERLTIHEWAGLWTDGERYRVGEHVLLFLYAPSRLGLTSTVSGGLGRFAIDSAGEVTLNPQHVQAFSAEPALNGRSVIAYTDFERVVRRYSEGRP
jgi:hypothetical protein